MSNSKLSVPIKSSMKSVMQRQTVYRIFALGLCYALALPAMAADSGLQYMGGLSTDGRNYTSTFAAGMKVGAGVASTNTAKANDEIQIIGHIIPQPDHIGSTASLFVVPYLDGQFYMKNSAGGFPAWSGNVAELIAVKEQITLGPDVEIPIFSGTLGINGKLDIYLGYRLTGNDALIYSGSPSSLTFVVGTDCIVSEWSAWGVASSGSEKRTRKVVTPANGGAACPALTETRFVPALPSVTALPTPLTYSVLPISSNALDVALLNFSHTANREWNYGGHTVAANFAADQGNWDYNSASYAAWLFDRASSWFRLYTLTQNTTYRDYAIRDTAWYASQINAGGYFIPKVLAGESDTKYGYVTPFLLYERVTGDTQYRGIAQRIYQASLTGFSNTYRTTGFWTEREAGLHGEAALAYYELTGEQTALDRAGAIIRQVGTLAAANGGAPQVPYSQHEGGGSNNLTNSPWMTAFYFQFARRYYELTGAQEVLQQASAYFDWLDVNGFYDGGLSESSFKGITVPRYLTGPLVGDANYSESDHQHCLDVAGLVSFAVAAKTKLGLSTGRAEQRLAELKTCSERAFAYWTRSTTTLPKYRIRVPRMWIWWMRGRYELQ